MKVDYYRQEGSKDKEEITRDEWFNAADTAGMLIFPNRLVNFTIGDISYTHKIHFDDEEMEDLKQRWRDAQGGPVSFLMDVPPVKVTPLTEEQRERLGSLPDGMIESDLQSVLAKPDGMWTWSPMKHSVQIQASKELIEDSYVPIEEYLANPWPTVRVVPAPLTRKQRFSRWIYNWRGRMGERAYRIVAGKDREIEEENYYDE